MGNEIIAVKALLEQRRESFLQVLPKTGIDPERFFRLAVYASQNEALASCDRTSLIKSIFAAAALGLSLDPSLGHAYLVPRRVNGKMCAQLQPGYRGLIELAMRSGRISQVHAEVVDTGDVFEVEKGTNRRIVHKPMAEMGMIDPTGLRAAYVTWKDLATGSIEFHVIGRMRIERAKKASQTAGKGFSPWASDEAAMWIKTAVHDCKKFWTLSPDLNRAVQLDVQQATGQQQVVDLDNGDDLPDDDRPNDISLDSLDEDSPTDPPAPTAGNATSKPADTAPTTTPVRGRRRRSTGRRIA